MNGTWMKPIHSTGLRGRGWTGSRELGRCAVLGISHCVGLTTVAHMLTSHRAGRWTSLIPDLCLLGVLLLYWAMGRRRDARWMRLALVGCLAAWLGHLALTESVGAALWFPPAYALIVALVPLTWLAGVPVIGALGGSLVGWPDKSLAFGASILSTGACMALARISAVRLQRNQRRRLELWEAAVLTHDMALIRIDAVNVLQDVAPVAAPRESLAGRLQKLRGQSLMDVVFSKDRHPLYEFLLQSDLTCSEGAYDFAVRLEFEGAEAVWVRLAVLREDRTGRSLILKNVHHWYTTELQLQEMQDRMAAQEQELDAQYEVARRAMRLRDDMERLARHDLRAPLKSIRASVKLALASGDVSGELHGVLAAMERTATRALAMTSLSLDLYRMEEGLFRLNPEPFDMVRLINQVLGDLGAQAVSKQIRVVFQDPGIPLIALGSEMLTMSIVENLTRNAIEAAPQGSLVTVSVYDASLIELSIHNEGEVPAEVRGRFFEKYVTHGKTGGGGLGTYSALLAARAQHGTLMMTSSAANGTQLLLKLPRAADQRWVPDDAAAFLRPDRRPLQLLLVDDDESHWIHLRAGIGSEAAARYAPNGQAAIEALLERRPDIIIMDLTMPVMGGIEALDRVRRLQKDAHERPSIVLAFTGRDDAQTLAAIDESGFDGVLQKPLRWEELRPWLRGERVPHVAEQDRMWVDEGFLDACPGFLDSRRKLINEIEEAYLKGEMTVMRNAAHTLAGSPGIYGFERGIKLCREIEYMDVALPLSWLQSRVATLRHYFESPIIRPT